MKNVAAIFLTFSMMTAVAEPATDLQARLQAIKGFTTEFIQVVRDIDGNEVQTTSGTMTVAKPGYLHWRSEAPYEQLLVADGQTLWFYDPDLEQVTIKPFAENISQTPAALLMNDETDLSDDYIIEQIQGKERLTFNLSPKNDASLYRAMALEFEQDQLSAMSLTDNLGQTTSVNFSQLKMNPEMDYSQFTFEVPEGTDIIREDGSL